MLLFANVAILLIFSNLNSLYILFILVIQTEVANTKLNRMIMENIALFLILKEELSLL